MFFTSSFQSWARGGFGGETALLETSCWRDCREIAEEHRRTGPLETSLPLTVPELSSRSFYELLLTLTSRAWAPRWLSVTEGRTAHSSCLSSALTAAGLAAPALS